VKRAASVPAIWLDERVPDLSSVLTKRLGIDPVDFAQWLAPLLGEYRSEVSIRAALPARSDELAWLDDLVDRADAATAPLRPSAVPDRAQALLVDEGMGAEINWFEFRARLVADLDLLRTLARRARSRLSAGPARRGRKNQRGRDELLAKVVDRLRATGLPELAARGVAEQVLVACRVSVPEHTDSVKRAARKGRK